MTPEMQSIVEKMLARESVEKWAALIRCCPESSLRFVNDLAITVPLVAAALTESEALVKRLGEALKKTREIIDTHRHNESLFPDDSAWYLGIERKEAEEALATLNSALAAYRQHFTETR